LVVTGRLSRFLRPVCRFALLAAFALPAFSPAGAAAQGCCTPGSSPLGGISGGALDGGGIEVGLWAEAYGLRQGYRGSAKIEDPALRESRVLTAVGFLRVGLHDRVALLAQFPFEYRDRTAPAIPGTGTPAQDFSNTAPGDLTTILLARVLPAQGPGRFALVLGAGAKWKTGPHDNRQDGLTLPVELQTGTGSTDPVVAAAARYLWWWGSVSSNAVLRLPARGETEYRYGNELNYTVTALRDLGVSWRVGLETRGRSAGRDDFRDFVRPNTGGSRVTLGPRVVFSFPGAPVVFEGAFQLPVYQHLNDEQLGVSEGASLGVRWTGL
jgi:hypothetical protein